MKMIIIENYIQLLQNSSNVLTLLEHWQRTLDEDAILEQSSSHIKENLEEIKTALLEGFKT